MAGLSNLYPPIVDSYMPAFVVTSETRGCKVYFSISDFNVYGDIRTNAQVSVKYQNSNNSALSSELYPNGIKICNVVEDPDVETDDRYYITIASEDIKGGDFELNQYYKIQIRFSDKNLSTPTKEEEGTWLAGNIQYFSEWSKVCLIRRISEPKVEINSFEKSDNDISALITDSTVDFIGAMYFDDKSETETLNNYRIRLYDNKENLLSDSGDIYSDSYNSTNEINYTFKYGLIDGNSYRIKLDIVTRNLYKKSYNYTFTVIQYGSPKLDAVFLITADNERGCIVTSLQGYTEEIFTGNITIRRSSSRSNFTIWEDVHTVALDKGEPLDYTWTDFSIESGVWYKYCVQRRDSVGNRSVALFPPEKFQQQVMVMFEDMFLVGDNTQLRIKYNPSVSSYKRTVLESKTDTIGSQHPFIKRNGYANYRQFPIGGMITLFDDYMDTFSSREELMGGEEMLKLYEEYNFNNRIGPFNDFIHEREFREKVINFLYADKVRLFRTLTEGNILIRLMDINLTPENALGRQIYSFTATAYEVDDCTIENIDKYNIQNIGDYSKLLGYDTEVLGQIIGGFKAGIDGDVVQKLLKEKYEKQAIDGYVNKIKKLTYLRIEFNMPPYLIKKENGKLIPQTKGEHFKDTFLGYICYINGVEIAVKPDGIYELKGDNISVNSIYFPKDTDATIDYCLLLAKQEDVAHLTKRTYFFERIGQVWGSFDCEDSVFKRIYQKYRYEYSTHYQKLISINGIKIQANPNTVVWIKESKDTDFERHVINDNGFLQIYDKNSVIEDFYFFGYHLEPATEEDLQREQLPYNKFVETGIECEDFNEIKKPIVNGVYTLIKKGVIAQEVIETEEEHSIKVLKDDYEKVNVEGSPSDALYFLLLKKLEDESCKYIYHDGLWKPFTLENDVLFCGCNVDAIVDYDCEIERGVYAR